MPGVYISDKKIEDALECGGADGGQDQRGGGVVDGSSEAAQRARAPVGSPAGAPPMSDSVHTDADCEGGGYECSSPLEDGQLPASLKSPQFDVYGRPRREPPPTPPCCKREYGNVTTNVRYMEVEWDGRWAASPGGTPTFPNVLEPNMNQFELRPSHIDFGVVAAGDACRRVACLTNVSAERARFHVSKPSPPLSVTYLPGMLAAGMKRKLNVEFRAESAGEYVREVVVKSELNILTLTCSVKVADQADAVALSGQQCRGSAASVASSGATGADHFAEQPN
ncbi:unnamed protein product [Ostreobium quekettii]|uniref:Abnormal spindle-like microcephaly-associated protein ASH domain-containing protein n=1 Tax=Ostreobium quekettii TaxID=121088 RepID=A0A8S1J4F7_9CHLO|nr:unnamed protein product [Ostreobium quekettii]|eukprot:evm.model.scf_642.5 EVM.evm.TU.scf_642.5   scf_642:45656-46498(-)